MARYLLAKARSSEYCIKYTECQLSTSFDQGQGFDMERPKLCTIVLRHTDSYLSHRMVLAYLVDRVSNGAWDSRFNLEFRNSPLAPSGKTLSI